MWPFSFLWAATNNGAARRLQGLIYPAVSVHWDFILFVFCFGLFFFLIFNVLTLDPIKNVVLVSFIAFWVMFDQFKMIHGTEDFISPPNFCLPFSIIFNLKENRKFFQSFFFFFVFGLLVQMTVTLDQIIDTILDTVSEITIYFVKALIGMCIYTKYYFSLFFSPVVTPLTRREILIETIWHWYASWSMNYCKALM